MNMSLPSRERELKQFVILKTPYGQNVAPFAGARVETKSGR